MPDETFEPKTDESWETRMVRDWLRKPFKPEQIGKLPATPKRPALDFVGHAAVTDRLNRIAPDWTYTVDSMFEANGKTWIGGTMTIGGVSRPEFGDGDDPKEAIGNFIRRGAMRFGVAIDLWSREELESSPAAGPAAAPAIGKAAGVATTEPDRAPQAGGTTSPGSSGDSRETTGVGNRSPGDITVGVGEAPAAGPGEAKLGEDIASPGSTTTTLDHAGFLPDGTPCSHRSASGRWLPTKQKDGVPVCPRCGMSAILYKESA